MKPTLFELRDDRLEPVPCTTFIEQALFERHDLQRLLRGQIEIVDPDLMILAADHGDRNDGQRRIDLLAIDSQARLVVIELKRADDGGHTELQALRHAALVSVMTFAQAVEAHRRYRSSIGAPALAADAEQAILEHLRWDQVDEERFATDVRIVLVSQGFSREFTTAVRWLADRNLDLRCIRLRLHRLGDRVLLDVQQIIPMPVPAAAACSASTSDASMPTIGNRAANGMPGSTPTSDRTTDRPRRRA